MLDEFNEEVEQVKKAMEETKEEEKKASMQRIEEILQDSRKDSTARHQRLTTCFKTLERRLVEDELARDVRVEEEKGCPLSNISNPAATAEEEEEDHIPPAQRMRRKIEDSNEVTSAPSSAPPMPKRTKRSAFGKYIREVAAAIEQPEVLLKKAPAKDLLDQYGRKLEEVKKARQEEARKRKLEEATRQEQKDRELFQKRLQEHKERIGPQSKHKAPLQTQEEKQVSSDKSSTECMCNEAIQEIKAEELHPQLSTEQEKEVRQYLDANPRMTEQEYTDYLLALKLQQEEDVQETAEETKARIICEQQIRRGAGTVAMAPKKRQRKEGENEQKRGQ